MRYLCVPGAEAVFLLRFRPFPLNRDGIHFGPLIVLRMLERFEIDADGAIELLRHPRP